MPPLPDLVLHETIRGLKRAEIPSYFAPFALLCGQPSVLRPPPSVLRPLRSLLFKFFRVFRARLNASRYDRRSAVDPTWAGKPMPRGTGFPARGFGTGRTLRPPSSADRPQSSALRPLSTVIRPLPSDFCALCASLRSTLGHPPTRRVQHPNIPEGETILPAPKQ